MEGKFTKISLHTCKDEAAALGRKIEKLRPLKCKQNKTLVQLFGNFPFPMYSNLGPYTHIYPGRWVSLINVTDALGKGV